MSDKLKDLRNQRGQLIKDARDIVDKADTEKRALSDDEKQRYDKLMTDQQKLADQIKREEQLVEAEREAAELQLRNKDQDGGKPGNQPAADPAQARNNPRATQEYRAAYERFLRSGQSALTGDEVRAMQADYDEGGGHLLMPEQMVNDLIKDLDDMVFIRSRSRVFSVPTAVSLGVPSLTDDIDDHDWTVELATGSEDTGLKFGKRQLYPHPVAKRVKISNELIRRLPGAETLVRQRIAYKRGITEEKAFLTGSGAQQPLGVFTASAHGITTSRDVSTGHAQTEMTFDGLIEAKYSLKSGYLANAWWLFHRDGVKQLAKIKDGEGRYIWSEAPRAGEPDRVLNLPMTVSEYVPNTFTSGQYVGILGDFSYYWIADAFDMTIQRLTELYAETNQMGLITRWSTDAMPVLENAFARVKLA